MIYRQSLFLILIRHAFRISSWESTIFQFFKGSKNVSIKGMDNKRQLAATFLATTTGTLLSMQPIYLGKSRRYLPKFTY